MITLFFVIPLLAVLSATILYRQTGKREFLKFDVVQFANAFIFLPILFVWFKSFVFYLLLKELGFHLSVTQLFIIDNIVSVIGLYIGYFTVIHSLTASFKIKVYQDPLHDLFLHLEYFHLWLSHLVIYIGAMAVLTFLSILNLFLPFTVQLSQSIFLLLLSLGVIIGALAYIGIKLADPKQGNFMRLMKLAFGIFFVILVVVYFTREPSFDLRYSMYWFGLMAFATAVFCSVLIDRSERANSLVERFKHHSGWGENISLFPKRS